MKRLILILILFCSFQGFGQSTNGAKGYWRLNGNSMDASGNNNNGTDTNITYSQANGKLNQGAGFNGSSSYINIGTKASLSLTDNFTLSIWMYPSATISSAQRLIINDYAGSLTPQYGMDCIATNKLRLEVFSSSTSASVVSNSSLVVGKWNMCTAVRDGSTIALYINGKFDNSAVWTFTQKAVTAEAVVIGASKNLSPSFRYFFNGKLDEVIIDNTAWSPAKIKNYYLLTSIKFSLSN